MKKLQTITNRVDNVTHIPKEYLDVIVPPPKSVKIELTNVCDLQCKFCANSLKERNISHMNFGVFQGIAAQIRSLGIREIGLFYLGESFLYSFKGQGLPEAVKIVKSLLRFPQVFVTTNGVSATKDKVKAVIEAGLDSLKFSYNFANDVQAKEYCGKPVFWTIAKNIQNAKIVRDEIYERTGHWCGLYASSMKYNAEQVDLMKDALSEIEDCIDEHYWIPFCNQGGIKTDIATKVRGNIGRLDGQVSSLPCWSLFTSAHITCDGDVTVCCFDHNGKLTIGNIFEDTFMNIWNGKKIQELRQHHLNKDVRGTVCNDCINA
jgi:radical SAM protein with 4Fe4S-binding SPASM domain